MQSHLKFILCYFLLSLLSLTVNASDIKVMTFNLRIPVDPYPNDWHSRLPRIIAIIKHEQPDFLGVQEVTPEMLADLKTNIPEYAVLGRGRDPDQKGEGTQIFYKKQRWQLDPRDHGTLQLSPTPDIPGSNGWHMQWPRIYTWAHLKEKRTHKYIYLFNTHFPLQTEERSLSAQQIAKSIAQRKYKNHSVVLTGDFNACEDEAAMKYLLGQNGSPIALTDSYKIAHPDSKAGTFHAFGKTESCKIDYIYTQGKLDVLDAKIIKELDNFSSDHYAVTANLTF